jgi:putative glutamine amidotransferase
MADVIDQRPHREDDSTYGQHKILAEPGTRVEAMCEPGMLVHSHHHQAVADLAPGLIVSARAEDGVIEGIELDGESFCVGVLWHPDAAHDSTGAGVFRGLVEAAKEKMRAPQPERETA